MKAGWVTKALGDVLDIRNGRNQREVESADGGYPIYGSAGNVMGYATSYICKAGATIIGRKGNINSPVYTKTNFWNVDTAFGLEAKADLNSRFLYYFCLSYDFSVHNRGTTIPSLVKSDLLQIKIPLPPLPEQQRIIAILDQAFDAIATAKANAEKNLENAREIFESYLNAVFTQGGEGWVEKKLEEVLARQPQNGWSPPAANHSTSGTPVLTLSSVTGFRFRPDKRKFTSAPTDSRRNYWIQNGDFLITRSNTPELVGHVAIAEGITEPTIYPDLIMRMNPAPDHILTEFLYFQMRAPELRKEIMGRAQGANPTMKKISNAAVKTLSIVVPPIAMQRAIVETMNELTKETQRLESIYQQKLATLDELKKSLLHQAFTGKL